MRVHTSQGHPDEGMSYCIAIYLTLSVCVGIVCTSQSLVFNTISLKASRLLFQDLIHVIISATLLWIDNMPTGRILHNSETDIYMVDHKR